MVLTILFLLLTTSAFAADTLPSRIDDTTFWKLIETLSEPSGTFQSENLLSNETDFPYIMSELQSTAKPDGAFLGVGPEQSFNYIATLHPKIAFIIDIRRQNMVEHLLYKALFELSPDRASFISRLFSRKRPSALADGLTAAELFDAYSERPADRSLFQQNLKEIESLLVEKHHFILSAEDRSGLERVFDSFREFGPLINYNSRGGFGGRLFMPSYSELMTETDRAGREWSYVATEANYQIVRDLEDRNLIIPLTGDFGGPKAIRAVGSYLKEHGAIVSAFYTSNVEGYLFQGGDRRGNPNGGAEKFYANTAMLPLDATSTFIRWIPSRAGRYGGNPSIILAPIQTTIDDFNDGRFTADNLFPIGGGFGPGAFNNPNNDMRRVLAARRSVWVSRLRIFFYLSWAGMGFLIRFLFWKTEKPAGFTSPRRLLWSLAWGVGGLVLAIVLGMLAGI